jgi:hypothetical protein
MIYKRIKNSKTLHNQFLRNQSLHAVKSSIYLQIQVEGLKIQAKKRLLLREMHKITLIIKSLLPHKRHHRSLQTTIIRCITNNFDVSKLYIFT